MIAMLPVFLSIRPALLRDAEERPDLSGSPEHIERGRFRIHFTRSGPDELDAIDADANGLPDLVDEIAAGLFEGEQEYLQEGWRLLANDTGGGGAASIDVYIHPLDAYGYATPIPASGGNGQSCFIELDENIQLAGKVARSVAKHELHHCIEFRYTATSVNWLYEAAATYEQYTHEIDPVLDYALGVLWSERLAEPERKLGDISGRFEYSAFLWMKYWSEDGGLDPSRLPKLWEALEAGETWRDALDAESLARFGHSLDEAYLRYAIWNSFACAADDGQHYRPDLLTCVADVTVPKLPWNGEPVDISLENAPFSSTYLEIPSDGEDIAVSCTGTPGLRYALVSVDPSGLKLSEQTDTPGLPIQIPSVPGGSVRLIVAGTSEEALGATCSRIPPTAPPATPTGCSTTSPPLHPFAFLWVFAFLLRPRASHLRFASLLRPHSYCVRGQVTSASLRSPRRLPALAPKQARLHSLACPLPRAHLGACSLPRALHTTSEAPYKPTASRPDRQPRAKTDSLAP